MLDYEARNAWLRQHGYSAYSVYLESDHWKSVRRKLVRKRGWRCEHCGTRQGIQVHHKTYERIGCEVESDLLLLCGRCHVNEHNRIGDFGPPKKKREKSKAGKKHHLYHQKRRQRRREKKRRIAVNENWGSAVDLNVAATFPVKIVRPARRDLFADDLPLFLPGELPE